MQVEISYKILIITAKEARFLMFLDDYNVVGNITSVGPELFLPE